MCRSQCDGARGMRIRMESGECTCLVMPLPRSSSRHSQCMQQSILESAVFERLRAGFLQSGSVQSTIGYGRYVTVFVCAMARTFGVKMRQMHVCLVRHGKAASAPLLPVSSVCAAAHSRTRALFLSACCPCAQGRELIISKHGLTSAAAISRCEWNQNGNSKADMERMDEQ